MNTTVRHPACRLPAIAGRVSAYERPLVAPWIDLRLDANEGEAPPPDLMEPGGAAEPGVVNGYPSTRRLEEVLAARFGVTPDRVLVTAGGDEAIDRVCRAVIEPGSEVILPSPTFEMIGRYARLACGEVIGIPWSRGKFPVDAMLARVSARTSLIAVVSPNNPTGLTAAPEDLERLAVAAPGCPLLVDLAYAEFAERDLTALALQLDRAVVIRTFSKAWGLAGLRVGYALGPAPLIAAMRSAGGPYSVAGPSIAAAMRVLEHGERWMREAVERSRTQRSTLIAALRAEGIETTESRANFVLARGPRAGLLRTGLASMGIAVRGFEGDTEVADAVRISCPGGDSISQRLVHSLRAVLAPQALLFDMDGVLADVSGSYRRAIALTARHFGVRLAVGEIASAKAEFNSNNDWKVTQRLLQTHGVAIPLDRVTSVFQRLYEGGDGAPGLRATERLIPDRAVLARLAERLPLAVVTGRPRREAEAFLSAQGIGDLFATLIGVEDAAPKPDPAPVRLALARLGVERAWMVGDTPDDIIAARAARVMPIAVSGPGDLAGRDALARHGPAAVLESLDQLEELLP